MSHRFRTEPEVREIIKDVYGRNYVAGLLMELAYLRYMRVGDVRFLKVAHIRQNNSYGEIYLKDDKKEINEWYPIPHGIYFKIQEYIKKNGLKDNDYIFEIKVTDCTLFIGHKGVITHEYLSDLWYRSCKRLGYYEDWTIFTRHCSICPYAMPKKRCSVFGKDNIKNRAYVHIKNCKLKGKVQERLEKHPRLHETLRGVGAISKVKSYIAQDMSYEEAILKVFHMGNWKSFKVFKNYMDTGLQKEIADNKYLQDWGDKCLI